MQPCSTQSHTQTYNVTIKRRDTVEEFHNDKAIVDIAIPAQRVTDNAYKLQYAYNIY